MKLIYMHLLPVVASVLTLSACGGGSSGSSSGTESTPVTQAVIATDAKSVNLRSAYESIVLPEFVPGKRVIYTLFGTDNFNRRARYELELLYLGTDGITGNHKVQRFWKCLDYNDAIIHLSKSTMHLTSRGETIRIEFIQGVRSGVNSDAVRLGKLPDSVDYTGSRSGLLSRLEGNDGGNTEGSWEWTGSSRGAATLVVREEEKWGNSKDFTLLISETKFYVKEDGDVPTFDLTIDVPGQGFKASFTGTKQYGR